MKEINFVFFGSSPISVTALDLLERAGFMPKTVVTQPDRPQGRGLTVLPSPVKTWALDRGINVQTSLSVIPKADVGVLVSYGRILPKSVIESFPKGILNLHPSLLPKLRGPSPIESTILQDMKDEIGVSIMLLDSGLDTGPILADKKVDVTDWPQMKSDLYALLSLEGAKLLAETLPLWIEGDITPKPQDNAKASYSKIIEKTDGQIDLSAPPYQNFLKFCAFEGWPGTFFYVDHAGRKIRVKITDASYTDSQFIILRVVPEGKREMSFEDFRKGYPINS